MNFPQTLGLILLVVGIVLQPIGWAYVHWLTPASFVLILVGVLLLFLGWREDRKDRLQRAALLGEGGLPGDIHGYSGQMRGGRSTSWESHGSIDGDGGD